MSGPAPPRPEEEARPISKRRRWLRPLLWVAGIAAVLFTALHTPPAKRLVAATLVRLASGALGGEVRLERLDYRLWAGKASVEGLEIRTPRLEVTCPRAAVGMTAGLRVRARVEAPRVVVTQGPEEEGPKVASGPSRPGRLLGRVASADLRDGALEIRRADGTPWLRLEGIDAQVESPSDITRGSLRVTEAGVGWPAVGIRVEPLKAEAEFEVARADGEVRVLRGTVSSDLATLEGSGRLSQIQPILARAEGHGQIDAGLARQLVPALELTGHLDARVSFEKDPAGARGTLSVEVRDLEAFDIGPWSGPLEATLEDRLLRLDSARLSGYGGRAEATGTVPLGEGTAGIDVRVTSLDLETLVATFVDHPPPLATAVDAELRIGIQDWDVDTLAGQGQAELRPTEAQGWPVAGPVGVQLAERQVSFRTEALRVRTVRVASEGSFSFEKDLDLRYSVDLPDLGGAATLLEDAGGELPPLALGGAVEIDGEVTGRLPEWSATARIESERVSVEDVDLGIAGVLTAAQPGIEIESFEARGVDGQLSARGFVPLDAAGAWAVEAELEELVLTDALARRGVPVPTTARGRLSVAGPRASPTARLEVDARAEPVPRAEVPGHAGEPTPSETDVPGDESEAPLPEREAATLHLVATLAPGAAEVEELEVSLGGGRLEGSGAWSRDGELDARVRVDGVQVARLPWLPGPELVGQVTSVLSGDLRLSGRSQAPEGRLSLLLEDTRHGGEAFEPLAFDATLDGARADLTGRLGAAPLLSGELRFEEQWPLHLELDLAALPLTRVARGLTGDDDGDRYVRLSGTALLDVPLGERSRLSYEARVQSLEVDLGGGGASAGPFTVTGTREALAVRGLGLAGGQGRLEVEGELGLSADAASPLVVHGELALADVAAFLPDTELSGRAAADLVVGGRLAAPEFTGELKVEGEGGRVGPVVLEALGLEATARDGLLEIRRGSVMVAGGEISARGSLPLGFRTEGIHTLEVLVQGVDPGMLLEVEGEGPRLVAPLDMRSELRLSALALDAIEAEGELARWSVEAGPETLALEKPSRWRYAGGRLTVDDLRLRGSQGHLGVDGTWAPGEGGEVRVSGEADLALLDPLLGGELLLSGPAHVDVTARGEEGRLVLEGGARLEGARAVLRDPPVVVSNLTGSLEARGRALELDARGTVGDGSLKVTGRVGLAATGPELDVALEAERVPLAFPEGLRSRSSGRVRLTGRERRYRVDGDVTVHRAVYDRETDFANQSLDSVGAELRALEERGSLLERVQLDVRVRLAEGLRIQNRQANLVLDGAATLGGDLLSPELQGSVSVRDGGTIRLSRATIRLVDGRINLAGFPSRPLEVSISGRTQVTGIQIDVDLDGPLDDLRTSLSSPNRSDLTQADLATLLLTGRTAQAAADESGAIVAEEVAAALGSALNERLGGAVMIDVSRDESLIVQDTDPTQRFNVGIPIGERLYVVYSQPLDRSGVRWILDFRPQGQFRVRFISDEVDGGAIEASHGFDFDLWSRGRRERGETHERPRVRDVRVEGVPPAEAAELLEKAKLKVGDRYDFFEGDRSARRIQEHLVGRGYRAALVESAEEPADEDAVNVVFRVERGPRIEVDWVGDDPGRKLRKRFEETWDAYLSLEETAKRRARQLRNELRARRWFQATVSAEVTGSESDARVVFEVSRGARGQGVDLVFQGNRSISSAALAAVLPPRKEAAFFELLEPTGASRLETALRTAGARAGFLSLSVETPREAFDPETGRLQVAIPVQEGEQARVVSLDLPEEATSLPGASPPELELRVGEPFRIDAYVDDRATLASWFRAQGFPEARLAGILEPGPEGMAVSFEADTGPRPRVGEVRVTQAGRTRRGVVDGAVTLEPGDLIRPEDLANSRDHLSETRVFRGVDIRTETTDDPGVRDLVVDLAERPDLNVEYKVRYETGRGGQGEDGTSTEESRGFQFGAGIEAANPFGRAHRYSVYGLVGKRRQLFGGSFEAQTFIGRRWRTQVFLFDDNEKEFETSALTRRVRTAAFQQTKRWRSGMDGRRWHDRLRMQWGYAYRYIDYLDPETGGTVGGYRAGVGNSLIGDTRDSVTDPRRGLFWTVTVEPNLKWLGSDKDFVRLYGQVFAYVPVGTRLVWAQGLRVGSVPGDDPLLLLDRRFKAGGATTVRGFAENDLGPQYQGYSLGGQATVIFNQELRFPIWDRVHGGVFYDAGNVWGLSRNLSLGDLRHSAGAGLRVMFPFGPIRLDWAWVLDPKDGEQRSRWQFALGHAF